MGLLKKSELIKEYKKTYGSFKTWQEERLNSTLNLIHEENSYYAGRTYDIFLSHSYQDARVIIQLKDKLQAAGYSVYVDWVEDKHLERGKVTEKTAETLRERMKSSKTLIYATSQSAAGSVWMPWELGYMDSRTGLVAVAPILDDGEKFEGREYLGLYPYLDLTGSSFYIEKSIGKWVTLGDWVNGKKVQ